MAKLEGMPSPAGDDEAKQLLACIFTGIMLNNMKDFGKYTREQALTIVGRTTAIACDLAESLDQQFKLRGWDKQPD